jgi:hypothetical protein
LESVLLGELAPTYPPRVLEIPTIHIVELLKVQVVTRDKTDRRNCGDPSTEQDDVAYREFRSESTDKSAERKIVRVPFSGPFSSVSRADQSDSMLDKCV